ncbi:ShlB/FhaC/HecB family hemolysin secretion/activation protein [Neosynechococcus sphagnicola]|uniref:ShlB/FhaC/HecB family hemolysin secretion/activation protein n=1 Tax=Neosynechococcus sphagnicola TaxID=1501145 RepID=UPI00195544BE|nr:ShlB/FhaC/HecB family hemolysin secretion/activation protein [Neosynechococcus sphagnicola]
MLTRPNLPLEPAVPTPSLPPPETLLQLLPPSEAPEPKPSVPGSITVKRFEVMGSTVFTPEDLAQVTAAFTGHPISFAELQQAAAAVTQHYIQAGYITTGALIPSGQVITAGIVKIQVIEGTLESIQITGTHRLNPNYIRSRLALGAKIPLNVHQVFAALQLLQLNPLIASLSANLTASAHPGKSVLEVKITEAPAFDAELTFDNGRSPLVGGQSTGAGAGASRFAGAGR